MNLINSLGELAVGSRLRRLSDAVMQDGAQIYAGLDLDFEPRWFPIFYLLGHQGPMPLTDIARYLDVTHPAIHQTAAEMTKRGLVSSIKSKKDKRKRLLKLTKKGEELLPQLRPVWDDIHGAVREIVMETGYDVLDVIEKLERAMQAKSLFERFSERCKQREREAVSIIAYRPEYRGDFERLNREWIEQYFSLEESDLRYMRDPESTIIEKGGFILFARDNASRELQGTVTLLKREEHVYELAKMVVTEKARGKHMGQMLCEALIAKARTMGAVKIVLETNSKLIPAINLYRKMGFAAVPSFKGSDNYLRSDVLMVLDMAQASGRRPIPTAAPPQADPRPASPGAAQ